MTKRLRSSTDPGVLELAVKMPVGDAWVIITYIKAGRDIHIASFSPATAGLARQVTKDMPDAWDDCRVAAWSANVDPADLGF